MADKIDARVSLTPQEVMSSILLREGLDLDIRSEASRKNWQHDRLLLGIWQQITVDLLEAGIPMWVLNRGVYELSEDVRGLTDE